MTDILLSYGSIAFVIIAGFVLARAGVLGHQAQQTLSGLAFHLLVPALLFSAVAEVDLALLISPYMAVVAGTAAIAAIAGALLAIASKRSRSAGLSFALAAGYPNAVNVGIPVALQLFGDIRFITPLILFELVVIVPLALTCFEFAAARPLRGRVLLRSLTTNPLLIACVAGLAFALTGWRVPPLLALPLDLVGGAAIPVVLLSFGMSLHSIRPFRSGDAAPTWLATAAKLGIAPLAAFALGVWLRLPAEALFAVVALSTLPTAQNAFIIVQRYGRHAPAVRDTVFLTTIAGGIVLMLAVALLRR